MPKMLFPKIARSTLRLACRSVYGVIQTGMSMNNFFTSKMFKMFNFFARLDANQFFRKLVGANFRQFFEKVPNFGLTKSMLTSTKRDESFPTIPDFSVGMAWMKK